MMLWLFVLPQTPTVHAAPKLIPLDPTNNIGLSFEPSTAESSTPSKAKVSGSNTVIALLSKLATEPELLKKKTTSGGAAATQDVPDCLEFDADASAFLMDIVTGSSGVNKMGIIAALVLVILLNLIVLGVLFVLFVLTRS